MDDWPSWRRLGWGGRGPGEKRLWRERFKVGGEFGARAHRGCLGYRDIGRQGCGNEDSNAMSVTDAMQMMSGVSIERSVKCLILINPQACLDWFTEASPSTQNTNNRTSVLVTSLTAWSRKGCVHCWVFLNSLSLKSDVSKKKIKKN